MLVEKRRVTGTSGIGIVIALVLMAVCFWGGMQYAAKMSAAQAGAMAAMAMGGGEAPAVNVITVEKSFIDIPNEYIGYVEAEEKVDIVPQVSGYLESVNFEEGSVVKKGQLLFKIEQKQYLAELELRKAQLAEAQASLEQSEKLLRRLKAADPKSISQLDLDNAVSAVASGKAAVQASKANISLAEINIDRTNIVSPIDGYIGKALVTEGNYVSNMTGTLAKVVKSDPVRVVFSLSDAEYLNMVNKFNDGSLDISMSLPDGTAITNSGNFDFEDNQIDKNTASIAMRAVFENKDRKLIPGAYVNISISDKVRPEGIVVPHTSIMTTADGSMIYVIDAESKAQIRPIVTGKETQGGIVIESGLEVGDVIIVQGLQKVRPGIAVAPQM